MKKIFAMAAIVFLVSVSSVFAFGEVTGPVVIYSPIGGSGVGLWGLVNNETTTVKLRVEGDANKYISLPSEVTLSPTGVYWVNVTATIPSDYDKAQGTNITGVMYAVLAGSPGQVQINLQLIKYVSILVGQTPPSITATSLISSSAQQSPSNQITGLATLPISNYTILSAVGVVIIIFALFAFVANRNKSHYEEYRPKRGGE